jgi:hypothetical protein
MKPFEIESDIRRLQTDDWFRSSVKICLEYMGEETTVGNVRSVLSECPCRIDWEEWAVKIKTRKGLRFRPQPS